ncbi:MAG TPA: zf-HC2 domain-containing protein [Terracidiphilus sp.]|nr:zf-HC2 domain-containing protein [Terracidiphilus sp.]
MTQPGAHPDAEVLTAFAERLLSDIEREQVLAHMAVCGRCREVAFLAQRAIEADPTVAIKAIAGPGQKLGAGWLTVWRWSWAPVAALAGIVGFAVLHHVRRTEVPQTQVAQQAPSPVTMPSAAATKSGGTSDDQRQQSEAEVKRKLGPRERTDHVAGVVRRSLDQKHESVTEEKDELAKATDLPSSAPVSGGVAQGAIAPRSKESSVGGPMVQNQVGLLNNAQLQHRSYPEEARQIRRLTDAANKPASRDAQIGAASESVSVQPEGTLEPASAVPSTSPQLAVEKDGMQVALSNKKLAKTAQLDLPSGLGVLAEAAAGKKIIALDTVGSLFLSDDGGKHWKPVNPRWTGRAVSVKVRPTADRFGGNMLTKGVAEFELITDQLEKWLSEDGQKWSLEPVAGK